MRIPNGELHHRHINTYGSGGVELTGDPISGCPLLYKRRYVDRDIPDLVKPELSYGSAIHRALYLMEEDNVPPEDAIQQAWDTVLPLERWEEALIDMRRIVERGGPLTTLHTLAVEQELTMPLYDDPEFGPIRYGGILDVIAVDGGAFDEPIPTLYLQDYKTDRGVPTRRQVENWPQGKGYALLLRANAGLWFPDAERVKIVGIYDAVKRYPITLEYTDSQLDEFQSWAIAVSRLILRDETAEPKLNPGCTWCPVRQDCPAWNGLPGDAETLLDRLSKGKLEFRFKQMDAARTMITRLEKMVADTKAAVIEKIKAEGPWTVGVDTWVVKRGNRREIVDMKRVHEIMGDDFYLVAAVGLGVLDKWLDDHREVNPEWSDQQRPWRNTAWSCTIRWRAKLPLLSRSPPGMGATLHPLEGTMTPLSRRRNLAARSQVKDSRLLPDDVDAVRGDLDHLATLPVFALLLSRHRHDADDLQLDLVAELRHVVQPLTVDADHRHLDHVDEGGLPFLFCCHYANPFIPRPLTDPSGCQFTHPFSARYFTWSRSSIGRLILSRFSVLAA